MIPIQDIIIRSLSGYVFIVPIIVLYYIFLAKKEREQSLLHIFIVCIFCYYLFGILTVTGIGYTSTISFRPQISLIPFVGMITGPIETILNIVLFVPMGLFLPLLYKKYNKFKTVVITGILFSVSIELVQMFNWGASDINDVMTNTMGACLGYLIYSIISKILPDKLDRQLKSKKVNAFIEVFLLSVCIFVIMVTVQPWFVHNVINIP